MRFFEGRKKPKPDSNIRFALFPDLEAAHRLLVRLPRKELPESFVFEATAELRWKNSGSGLKIEQKWKRVSGEGFEWRPIPWVEEGEK